jgi:hypothetical protein
MNLEQSLVLAWNHKDMHYRCPRPGVGEAYCIIADAVARMTFNWITGQEARDTLLAAFLADLARVPDEIHAVKDWYRKVKLYKLAYRRSSFRAFWLQFGVNDRYEKQDAQGEWKRQNRT